MSKYFLAVDIGASSGRHILCQKKDGKLVLEEVYRFENGNIEKGNHIVWDTKSLINAIVEGIKKCAEIGKIPYSMAIDTWGVDFALLDDKGEQIGDMVAYRDERTKGVDKIAEALVSFKEHYSRTGIQKQSYNTVYQLLALKKESPQDLTKAKALLMVPQYLNYLLTGVKGAEYTHATTSALINAKEKQWDFELIEALGINKEIFLPISMPGTKVGDLTKEIANKVGFNLSVVNCASHDTASAFLAVPAKDENAVYISSGTWSLLGVENTQPFTEENSRKANFSNEGGYDYRFRYLKNIMGLWMIQSVRRNLDKKYSFMELEEMAKKESGFKGRVNVNDDIFLNPKSMVEAVTNEATVKPENIGQLMECIYRSLAECYALGIKELEEITGKKYTSINIVGGGSKDGYLNMLTAEKTGLPVMAGPTEGTAIGNLIVQLIAAGEVKDLSEAREMVKNSFSIKNF